VALAVLSRAPRLDVPAAYHSLAIKSPHPGGELIMRSVRPVVRFLLLAFAIVIMWTAWWFWPERPVRVIRMDGYLGPDAVGQLTSDGKALFLSSRSKLVMPQGGHQRVIDLECGADVISPDELLCAYIAFDKVTSQLFLWRGDGTARVFNVGTRRWDDDVHTDLQKLDLEIERRRQAASRDSKPRWQASVGHLRWSDAPAIEQWLHNVLKISMRSEHWYDIRESSTNRLSRRIPNDKSNFIGVAPNDRAWGVTWPANNTVFLNEWDVDFVRPPWWLWLLSLGSIVWIFRSAITRSMQPSDASSKHR